jgi:hypothetical protein
VEQSQAKRLLGSLPVARKACLCARLCHELTIIGRNAYESPTSETRCERLRAVNEIQHRATGILAEILEEPSFSPDDALATMFCAERADKYLERQLMTAFDRVSRSFGDPSP